jgi:hypothetical protein
MTQDEDPVAGISGISDSARPSGTKVLIVTLFILLCGCCVSYFAMGRGTAAHYLWFWQLAVKDCGAAQGTGLVLEHFETRGWDPHLTVDAFDYPFSCEEWKGEKSRRIMPAATPRSTP